MDKETLFKKAQTVMPGGVSSPVRSFKSVGGTPPFISEGKGAFLKDTQNKKYIDFVGSYGPAKGQKVVLKCLEDYKLPMIATSSATNLFDDSLKEIKLINATYEEYNVLLKNAKAVICMSEFEEGWCRVLHEAAIHGTIILGSGKGGMKKLLEIGGLKPSSADTLTYDFNERIKEKCLSRDKVELYRTFTLKKFYESWQFCVEELLNYKEKSKN